MQQFPQRHWQTTHSRNGWKKRRHVIVKINAKIPKDMLLGGLHLDVNRYYLSHFGLNAYAHSQWWMTIH